MRIRVLAVLAVSSLAASGSAQQPVITSFAHDGTITWTNTSTNCVAVLEEFSPATSGQWMSVYAMRPTSVVSQVQIGTANAAARLRVLNADRTGEPERMVYVPGGWYMMGDSTGDGLSDEVPVHPAYISPFFIDRFEITKSLWDAVYTWAIGVGYSFYNPGSAKAEDHPVVEVSWYDCILWCNARSEYEGLTPCYYTDLSLTQVKKSGTMPAHEGLVMWEADGYRLPTEAEWEKAARGGLFSERFPWGPTVDHARANYRANGSAYDYDTSPYTSWTPHPDFDDGVPPFTCPVSAFAPNGFGLHNVCGNVDEICWDGYGPYPSEPVSDPRGGVAGYRTSRGGYYAEPARHVRCSARAWPLAGLTFEGLGFRCVRVR